MKRSLKRLRDLSPAQREIMQIIWERGELAASEVRGILSQKRRIARNTVRTMLERMEEKGWLKHREIGRTYLYSSAQPREATITQRVLEVVEDVCGGSPETLVNALLDSRSLTTGELARIQSILDDAKAPKPKRRS
jgi:BlaI family transcriptional regulator, penicillinase repressor